MYWKPWNLELLALFGCLVSFAGLVILLAIFNGRSVFAWHAITLNAIVSILSVALKVTLVFSVSECIGQWKWLLFTAGQRNLMEFERIDLASRGPLGSTYLIWRRHTP